MINYERRRLPHPHLTDESRPEKALRRKMFEQKGIPFLRGMDLDAIMRHSVMSFEEEVQEMQRGDPLNKMRKYVFFVEGIPGSGKTHTVNHLILPYLQTASERMKKNYEIDVKVRYLQWDNLEDNLIEQQIINPKPGEPFSPEELKIVGSFMKLLTAYSLQDDDAMPRDDIQRLLMGSSPPLIQPDEDETQSQFMDRMTTVFQNLLEKFHLTKDESSPYTMLVIEKCGATAIKKRNILLEKKSTWTPPKRQYFPDMLDDLHHQEPPFTGIDRKSFFSTAIGCVGGPSMEVLIRIREMLGNIELDAANELYAILGLDKLEKQEKELAGYGGSLAQIQAAREQIWPQLLSLPTDGNSVGEIVGRLPEYIRKVISLEHPLSLGFPESAWDDPLGKELIWLAVDYSKLFEPLEADEQNRTALQIFWASCFRLAEASILMNNLLEDEDKDKKVNCGTVILNNPILQLTEKATGIFGKRSSKLI